MISYFVGKVKQKFWQRINGKHTSINKIEFCDFEVNFYLKQVNNTQHSFYLLNFAQNNSWEPLKVEDHSEKGNCEWDVWYEWKERDRKWKLWG